MARHGHLLRALPAFILASLLVASLAPLFAEAPTSGTEDTEVIFTYEVVNGKLDPHKPIPSKTEQAIHRKIWAAVETFIPPALSGQVGRVEFFTTADGYDPETATDAYATLSDDSNYFILGLSADRGASAFIDFDQGALEEYARSVIHEFGHVLSLNASQMTEGGDRGLKIDEGVLKRSAYLNQFYEKFWATEYPDHGPATSSGEDGDSLYEGDPNSFVTQYAATGPLEDFAETFATFVFEDKPSAATIAGKKILYLYSKPDIVSLRDAIRKGLEAL